MRQASQGASCGDEAARNRAIKESPGFLEGDAGAFVKQAVRDHDGEGPKVWLV